MSYTKQNFKDGQTLKAEHLNHIEDGIANLEQNAGSAGSEPLIVTVQAGDDGELVSTHTNEDILAAFESGRMVSCVYIYEETGEIYIKENHVYTLMTVREASSVFCRDGMYISIDNGGYVRKWGADA